jgi:capsular polysaccharide biosynthesis protein
MEFRQYWQIFRRRWWIPFLLMALVAVFSLVQLRPWQTPPPFYNASMRMLVGVLPAADADVADYDPRYYAWLTSEYLVDDFTEVVRSDLFAQNVSARLSQQDIQIPAGTIRGSAATGKQHRIITLSFGWPDETELSAITAAAADELTENASLYFQQLGTDGAGITLLDAPVITLARRSLRDRLDLPLRLLIAFVLGVGVVFLLDYMDTSVRGRADLEALGYVILGEIPKHR